MIQKNSSGVPLVRWSIIGPGQIAHHFIEDMPLATNSQNEVIAIMSNDLSEAADFTKKYNIPQYFDSLAEMLEMSHPDIVYIATPHAAHYGQANICLQYKIPVLCEKPFAINKEQAKGIIHTSQENSTFLMEGMWIRFLPDIKFILALLEQNAIGKLNSLIADMSYRAPKDLNNRFYNPALGGGSLLDLGIYPVYLSLLSLGIPDNIKATALLSESLIDISCAVIFEYVSKAYALLESSIIKNTSKQAIIYGEDGWILIRKPWNEKPPGIVVSLYEGSEVEYPFEWEGRGFQFEIQEVVDCLTQGLIECPLHNHDQSLTLMGLMDEIRRQTGITYPSE